MNSYHVKITLRFNAGGTADPQYDIQAPTAKAAIALGKKLARDDFKGISICGASAAPNPPDPAPVE